MTIKSFNDTFTLAKEFKSKKSKGVMGRKKYFFVPTHEKFGIDIEEYSCCKNKTLKLLTEFYPVCPQTGQRIFADYNANNLVYYSFFNDYPQLGSS